MMIGTDFVLLNISTISHKEYPNCTKCKRNKFENIASFIRFKKQHNGSDENTIERGYWLILLLKKRDFDN